MSARTELVDEIARQVCECYAASFIDEDEPGPHPTCRRTARRVLAVIQRRLRANRDLTEPLARTHTHRVRCTHRPGQPDRKDRP